MSKQSSLIPSDQSALWQELTDDHQEAIQGGNFDAFTKVVVQTRSGSTLSPPGPIPPVIII